MRVLLLLSAAGAALAGGTMMGVSAWDEERTHRHKGNTHSADVGLRALRAVGRGGATRPAAMVTGVDLLEKFQEALEAGLWEAPHDQWEKVDDSDVYGIFTEQAGLDLLVSILAMVATISAAGAGIGGGGLLVPIYLLVMGWSPDRAVPLSNATIFGNAITNIIINFPLRHPTADRPLVDFDLALILIPMELTGSLIGVLLNIIFPNWLTLTCLFLLLCFTTYRTYFKGKATWDKENIERKKAARVEEAKNAAAGAVKTVSLTRGDDSVDVVLVNGKDKHAMQDVVSKAFAFDKAGKHFIFRDDGGAKMKDFAFNTVDEGESYHLEVFDIPVNGLYDAAFKAKTFETEPAGDHAPNFVVLPAGAAEHKKHLGKGQPYETWSTDMVVSWLQAVSKGYDYVCSQIDAQKWTGTELLAVMEEAGDAQWARVGVSAADGKKLAHHLQEVIDEDHMLLVHSSKDLPWGSWNRSAEWIDADGQLEGRDLDGWLPDDPNHPKNNPATYVAGVAYVDVDEWTVQDVLKWADKVTDYNYDLKQQIIHNDVTGLALRKMTVDDLKLLGVPQLGPRLALLARVREIEHLVEEHQKIVDQERAVPYRTSLQVLFWSWFMLLVLALLKGGGKSGGQSPVAGWQGKTQEEFCGSPTFWVLWWIGVPVLIVVTILAGDYLIEKHGRKIKVHFKFHEGDIYWNKRAVRIYPVIVIAAGVLAGLLGVGGAMVTGPLMLEMNMLPRVSTATSSFLIIFTTGVAAIAYIALGTLQIDYAIWFAIMGAVGAAIGLNIIQMLLKKYNRQSLVIWSLTLVFVLAIAGTLVSGITRVMADLANDNNMGFRPIC
eukprot:TRINITY_DN9_c0_g2_i2.p1 TRINITY_DN9_c0_g2~~TRINITY_DN9_c0_g2_i2.p1  ORF type:complete len:830 (+),score=400.65 TRINITY_DN9_c0_g2_i2:69-2558(+)